MACTFDSPQLPRAAVGAGAGNSVGGSGIPTFAFSSDNNNWLGATGSFTGGEFPWEPGVRGSCLDRR